MRALRAELRPWQNQVSTLGASVSQRSGALRAESRFRPVVVLAPQTLHLIRQLSAVTGGDNLLRVATRNNPIKRPGQRVACLRDQPWPPRRNFQARQVSPFSLADMRERTNLPRLEVSPGKPGLVSQACDTLPGPLYWVVARCYPQ